MQKLLRYNNKSHCFFVALYKETLCVGNKSNSKAALFTSTNSTGIQILLSL